MVYNKYRNRKEVMNMARYMTVVDLNNRKKMNELIEKHKNSCCTFVNRSDMGEVETTTFYDDRVVLTTYKNDGYVLTVVYHKNGKMEKTIKREED